MSDQGRRLPYQRIILKLSGEALKGQQHNGIDPQVIARLSNEIKEVMSLGIQLGVVIGGGNLFRGATLSAAGLDRVTADHMGMLATMMNALALRDTLEQSGLPTRVMSAIPMSGLMDHYDRRKAIHHLSARRVIVFAAGTGNPFVTTDSAASLRSIEMEAQALFKATNVDGIYSKDPSKHDDARKFSRISYQEALDKELGVMDLAAFCQCRDYNIPIRVFNINRQGALLRAVQGDNEGTLVSRGEETV